MKKAKAGAEGSASRDISAEAIAAILTASHARHPKNIPLKRSDNLDEEDLPRNTWAGIPLVEIAKHANGLWALIDATILDEPAGQLAIRAFGSRLSVPVHLHSKVTEVGTLELWCRSRDNKQRWKLEFNVRETI